MILNDGEATSLTDGETLDEKVLFLESTSPSMKDGERGIHRLVAAHPPRTYYTHLNLQAMPKSIHENGAKVCLCFDWRHWNQSSEVDRHSTDDHEHRRSPSAAMVIGSYGFFASTDCLCCKKSERLHHLNIPYAQSFSLGRIQWISGGYGTNLHR
jgi:hypothetical protein